MPKTKTEKKRSRSRGRHRGVQSRANADLGSPYPVIDAYQDWCRQRDLGDYSETVAEGKAMSHCVRSYTRNCRTGRKAIYSVQRRLDEGRWERLLTIAINPQGRRIIQARGKHNASPLGKIAHLSKKSLHDRYRRQLLQARGVMRRWEEQEDLVRASNL